MKLGKKGSIVLKDCQRSIFMHCFIEEYEQKEVQYLGAPKEIIVKEFAWENHGEKGTTYTYEMSKERFERKNPLMYRIVLETEEKQRIPVATMSYYDFVDYSIEDCIGERKLEMISKEVNCGVDEIWEVLKEQLLPIKEKIKKEYECTPEYVTVKQNQEIISRYHENKTKFCREWGVDGGKYDRCYDVFGNLRDADYLAKLQEIVREREKFSENSRKKHKQAWRNYSNNSSFFQGNSQNYSEEERELLSKFYKVLAKKYHPDANLDVDTAREMQLLNRIKKQWGV